MARAKSKNRGSATVARMANSPVEAPVGRTPAIKALPADESQDANQADPETKPFKRNDLLAAVTARSPLPKSDLRTVVELVLDEMGNALADGHDLALPPLGRIKVQKRKENGGAEVLSLRLRRKSAGGSD